MHINKYWSYVIGISGCVFGNCAYFTCFFISLSLFSPPPLSPLNNWISDLGYSLLNPRGAIWFNIANILSGIGMTLYYVGFRVWYTEEGKQNLLIKLTQIAGCVNALTIVMLGIFPEDQVDLHSFWAGIFFNVNFVVFLLTFLAFRSHRQIPKWFALYSLVVAGINLTFIILMDFHLFWLEWLTVFTGIPLGGLFLVKFIISFRQEKMKQDFSMTK